MLTADDGVKFTLVKNDVSEDYKDFHLNDNWFIASSSYDSTIYSSTFYPVYHNNNAITVSLTSNLKNYVLSCNKCNMQSQSARQ